MLNLKLMLMILVLLLTFSIVKIVYQSSREKELEDLLQTMRLRVAGFDDLEDKHTRIVRKLEKTTTELNACAHSKENLQKKHWKTRETLEASIQSLKSSNTKKDACVMETSKLLLDKENIEKEKKDLEDKVKTLEIELKSKSARVEELAKLTEKFRTEHAKKIVKMAEMNIHGT